MLDDTPLESLFANAALWDKAKWSATAFQFHPTGECPPVLGIVFDDAEAGREVFAEWVSLLGNHDSLETIRVSIIEGDLPGQREGCYTVHICPDPIRIATKATAEGIVLDSGILLLGRVNRLNPRSESPSQLPTFKEQYKRHREYLLAPVTRRNDGRLWTDVEFSIVKTAILFRDISEIGENDIDSVALLIRDL